MSRSHKKTPIFTNTGESQKEGKQNCNRIFRHMDKIRVNTDDEPLYYQSEALNSYSMNGDGKRYRKMLKSKK